VLPPPEKRDPNRKPWAMVPGSARRSGPNAPMPGARGAKDASDPGLPPGTHGSGPLASGLRTAARRLEERDMNVLIALLVGGIVGWLASILMRTNAQMGVLMNILVGLLGGALGAWLAPWLGLFPEGLLGTILVAILGSALVILLLKLLRVLR
jgi:uncharacterized membrane protein YeaQ/YmgE (transglycosylase-associated protein family)